MNNFKIPAARSEDLIIQGLGEEVLVYDLKTDKAHCLNQTTAIVWNACDGKNSINKIIESLENQTGGKVSEDLVWLAIDLLNERNLLTEKNPQIFSKSNRREVLKKVGLASVVALPIIASLVAPTAAFAVACSGTVTNCVGCPDGTPCDVDMDTIIGMCLAGACAGD